MRRSPGRVLLVAGVALCLAACSADLPCGGPLWTGTEHGPCCPGQVGCKVGPGLSICVDPLTSQQSCGACWLECGPGTCVAGACVCPPAPVKLCPPDLPDYSDYPPGNYTACVDTSTDSANCGDCGVRCGTDQWCVGESCVRDDRCDGVTCRSALVCGTSLPCETCLHGACVDLSPHFRDCVPSCGVAASACGQALACNATSGTCQASHDCRSCCTSP